ncbi:hypothetical protein RUM44_013453 [Polyplax serrata]|uniref:Uncharacterized protein n=1 Tax=Polyplax serrata TaxID=468196 RepID=A0ABR1BIX9_POLSC
MEEDDSNLMDFLRTSGQEIACRERKSWGSLDRSWARRARGGRRRPDLLSADFSGERERPTSPSPLAESKPLIPVPENDNKPKPWKQKIEAWLQENEKEENEAFALDEIRRRNRRNLSGNRRSLEGDSESETRSSILDPLPEEKVSRTNDPMEYKRVYPDWKPTIDKTDVVGVMEAIEEAQPQIAVKDKSIWRKSNLNVPNAADDADDPRKIRRQRSRNNMEQINTSNLMLIKEEEKKKGLISALSQVPVQDRLTLYLRRPTEDRAFIRSGSLRAPSKTDSFSNSGSIPNSPIMSRSQLFRKYRYGANAGEDFSEEQALPPSVPRRFQKTRDEVISDKIEIDSDNIETPPVTRRKFGKLREFSSSLEDEPRRMGPIENSPRDLESPPEETDRIRSESKEVQERGSLLRNSQRLREIAKRNEDEEVLGDGQFDRFSSARRTRRYKKSQDSGAENTEKEMDDMSPEVVDTQSSRPVSQQTQSEPQNKSDDKEARLKKWQNRLKYHGTAVQNEDSRLAQEAIIDINKVGSELQNIEQVTSNGIDNSFKGKINRKERAQSLIEPSQVMDAKRANIMKSEAKSPSNNHISQTYLNQDKSEFIPEIRVQANTPGSLKVKTEHELNDEGFEETQSLGSETPSQGTSSGCNYEQDSVDSPRLTRTSEGTRSGKLNRADSSGSGDTNTSSGTNAPAKRFVRNTTATRSLMTPSRVETLMQRLHRPDSRSSRLDRSNSVKVAQKPTEERRSLIARSTSMRKTDSQTSLTGSKTNLPIKRRGVERSNSKTSLRSSRSSLNSSTSVNTVRNVPAKPAPSATDKPTARRMVGYTSAIKSLTDNLKKDSDKSIQENRRQSGGQEVKKPLSQVQLKSSVEGKPKPSVPASRSSSSGSSIGPSARRPKATTLSTSFKENAAKPAKPQSALVAGSRNSSTGSITSEPPSKVKSSNQKENTGIRMPRAALNFMKPTAASAAKEPEMVINKFRPMAKAMVK